MDTLPANWYWPPLALAALVAGLVWGWGGVACPPDPEEEPAAGPTPAQDERKGG